MYYDIRKLPRPLEIGTKITLRTAIIVSWSGLSRRLINLIAIAVDKVTRSEVRERPNSSEALDTSTDLFICLSCYLLYCFEKDFEDYFQAQSLYTALSVHVLPSM